MLRCLPAEFLALWRVWQLLIGFQSAQTGSDEPVFCSRKARAAHSSRWPCSASCARPPSAPASDSPFHPTGSATPTPPTRWTAARLSISPRRPSVMPPSPQRDATSMFGQTMAPSAPCNFAMEGPGRRPERVVVVPASSTLCNPPQDAPDCSGTAPKQPGVSGARPAGAGRMDSTAWMVNSSCRSAAYY